MSDETFFTKGPWRYNVATNGEVVAINERGPDSTVVEADSAAPHNSWLIAAAPDLYDALEYALPYLKTVVPSPRNGVNHDKTTDINCVDRAINALARARGES